MVQPPQTHTHKQYDNTGKGWYFRFDYGDNKMSYKYIPSITYTWTVSWTHTVPFILKKISKVIDRTNCILDTLSTEYDDTNPLDIRPREVYQWKHIHYVSNLLMAWLQTWYLQIMLTCDVQHESSRSLQWRHNGPDSVSNHQPHDCLFNRLSRRRSKKTSKLCVTGLCTGNSPGTGEFPAQMASYAENVSIWWRYHVSGCMLWIW